MKNTINLRSNDLYQLKITLLGTKPPIWRRVIVEPETRLKDLHKIIQCVMGWANCHLHQFRCNDECYAASSQDQIADSTDYSKIRLQALIKSEADRLIYDYDFGDGWEHTIVLEKKVPRETIPAIPLCTAGKRNCPPEDCGGIPGFYNLLEILSDPRHDEYDDMIDWLDEDYNPEEFDIDSVNLMLQQKNYGCNEISE